MKNKVVMVLTNGFISDPRVYKEAIYLKNKGFDITVLCWDRKDQGVREEVREGIKIKRYKYKSKYGSGILKQSVSYLKFINSVKKYIKNNSIDYIHFHDLDAGLIALCLKKDKRCKYILDMHEQYDRIFKGIRRFLIKYILKRVTKKIDSLIFVNEVQYLDYKNMYSNKEIVILPNYPEARVFENVKRNVSKIIRISFIGSVRDYKSLSTLLEAFGGNENYIISIIGSGVAQETLQLEYKKFGNVKFIDNFVYDEIVGFYNLTDITYAAYDTNNDNYNLAIPVKVYESICCKIPVIVSSGTEVSKLINNLNLGISVEFGDIDAIKKDVEELLSSFKMDEVNESLEKYSKSFIWEKEVGKLEEIYDAL